jgi:hypothetical protein
MFGRTFRSLAFQVSGILFKCIMYADLVSGAARTERRETCNTTQGLKSLVLYSQDVGVTIECSADLSKACKTVFRYSELYWSTDVNTCWLCHLPIRTSMRPCVLACVHLPSTRRKVVSWGAKAQSWKQLADIGSCTSHTPGLILLEKHSGTCPSCTCFFRFH